MVVVDWFLANYVEVSAVANTLFAFLWTVAKLTPTTWDDSLLGKLQGFFNTQK